jgi:purine nucleosidase
VNHDKRDTHESLRRRILPEKVIIDCDVGVDDALALILAFRSPELEVMAVTGVNGNVPLDLVFENIQKVLCLIRPEHRPLIAKGADRPLKGTPVYARSVHGESGLGAATIEKKGEYWNLYAGTAHDLIPMLARRCPGEVTLIATGPLTNLALALQKDPEGMGKVKEICIMGGAVRTKGNITPYAEFNIYSDPIAAKRVFGSGLPMTLVPLDVTHQVSLTARVMEEKVIPIENALCRFLTGATGYDAATHCFPERERIYLHDPLAVGVVVEPGLVKRERLSLHVNTEEGDRWGHISEASGENEIEVCLEVDSQRFLNLFLSRLIHKEIS